MNSKLSFTEPVLRVKKLFKYLFLSCFALFMITPFIVIAVTSIGKNWFGKSWLPASWGWDWYIWAWNLGKIPEIVLNTLIIAAIAIAVSLLVGIPTAWALAKRNIKAKELLLSILLLPRMIPPLAYALGISKVFYGMGLIDTHLGVGLAHVAVCAPYSILILTTTFENLDDRIVDAAGVCGANPFQTFIKVILPMILPGILASIIFTFTTSYNEFTLTIMTYGPKTMTLPVKTYLAIGDGYWEVASAISMILLIPSLVILFAIQRMLKPENLMGGFKGV